MKAVYITSASFPSPKASTVQVMMMCQAMARLGHAVTLCVPETAPVPSPVSRTLFEYYGVDPVFEVRRIPRANWRAGSAVFQVRSLLAARLRRDSVCYARGRDWLAPAAALAFGTRAIFEVHGLPASSREAMAVRYIGRSPRGRLVVISNALRGIYADLWRKDGQRRAAISNPAPLRFGDHSQQSAIGNVVVAPDGVDLRRFTPPMPPTAARAAVGLPADRPLVVYVGSLYGGRGLETLIAAMQGLAARLVIVGGQGREIARCRSLAHDVGVEVVFVGHRPPAEVPRYLFAADVLAMPYSRSVGTPSGEDTAEWMSPLKMFEYMAAGRPIVASDLPALREVLAHEVNALLAEPGNAGSLRVQLERALADQALAERLSSRARQDVLQYTWETRAARILESLN